MPDLSESPPPARAGGAGAGIGGGAGGGRDGDRAARGGRLGRAAAALGPISGRAGRRGCAAAAVTAQGAGRAFRAAVSARGAGESGLARVIELHLVSTAVDTLIVTALASTIFFSVPAQAARGRVGLSLAITMVPFVVLAPLIGPLLDRVPRGRRYALAGTMVARAWLAWVLADAVHHGPDAGLGLYPAAFGFLVCQKAYLVTRAAATPRVQPARMTLVQANSRVNLAGLVAMTLTAPAGAGLTAWLGAAWTLRLAFLVSAAGSALALALPAAVDQAADESPARLRATAELPAGAASARPAGQPPRAGIGRRAVLALRGNTALRGFTGFLTLFLAFRLRTAPIGGLGPAASVALVIGVFGVAGGIGTALGALLPLRRPDRVVAVAVVPVAAIGIWSALAYGLWPVLAVTAGAGAAQSLTKLCLDALIQTDVPEGTRTSAFARTETVLQLAWVGGGAVGLVLPLSGPWGIGLSAAALLAVAGWLIRTSLVR